jgi:hypothetical protein
LGYEPNELPGCSTPLFEYTVIKREGQSRGAPSEVVILATAERPHRNFFPKKESASIGYLAWRNSAPCER